jgi:hypothetical protein
VTALEDVERDESADRLPQRWTAHAELGRQFPLRRQPLSGLDLAAQKHLLDDVDRLASDRSPGDCLELHVL